jgi:hypothetical protein
VIHGGKYVEMVVFARPRGYVPRSFWVQARTVDPNGDECCGVDVGLKVSAAPAPNQRQEFTLWLA